MSREIHRCIAWNIGKPHTSRLLWVSLHAVMDVVTALHPSEAEAELTKFMLWGATDAMMHLGKHTKYGKFEKTCSNASVFCITWFIELRDTLPLKKGEGTATATVRKIACRLARFAGSKYVLKNEGFRLCQFDGFHWIPLDSIRFLGLFILAITSYTHALQSHQANYHLGKLVNHIDSGRSCSFLSNNITVSGWGFSGWWSCWTASCLWIPSLVNQYGLDQASLQSTMSINHHC